ncbi:hypothetical protein [Pseudovibrio sp. SPO723]|uniref:antibiotic biosynthesis monooxygenase family protein n=1 Tax=Nesiotobacter zosterae TaxID=392721 RepID=UPI0029C401DC|nr:hypothetical protein [Pseudovibrio sp. SPO723]MDX5592980.1 hypothetical protein [Pseudovibrio sp. SPO723]
MTKQALEVVEFKLKEGANREAFMAAAHKTEAFVRGLDGFVNRTLSCSADNTWLDVVEWRDMAAAKEAGKKFMACEHVVEFCSFIDMDSTRMQHLSTHMKM